MAKVIVINYAITGFDGKGLPENWSWVPASDLPIMQLERELEGAPYPEADIVVFNDDDRLTDDGAAAYIGKMETDFPNAYFAVQYFGGYTPERLLNHPRFLKRIYYLGDDHERQSLIKEWRRLVARTDA